MRNTQLGAASTTKRAPKRSTTQSALVAIEGVQNLRFTRIGVTTERVYGCLGGDPRYTRQVGKWLIYAFGFGKEWAGSLTQLCVVDDFGNLVAVPA